MPHKLTISIYSTSYGARAPLSHYRKFLLPTVASYFERLYFRRCGSARDVHVTICCLHAIYSHSTFLFSRYTVVTACVVIAPT